MKQVSLVYGFNFQGESELSENNNQIDVEIGLSLEIMGVGCEKTWVV